MASIDTVLETHQKVVEEGFTKPGGLKYRTYVVSTLRGGVGKSTLAFNLSCDVAVVIGRRYVPSV
jgi:chromosome partitioning protein